MARLETLIVAGVFFYFHFGTLCGSFSTVNNLNGGTRTRSRPEGDGPVEREVIGNVLAFAIARLCSLLIGTGAYFSIENLASSRLWWLVCISNLDGFYVDFSQCMYGLVPPGPQSSDIRLLKKPSTCQL